LPFLSLYEGFNKVIRMHWPGLNTNGSQSIPKQNAIVRSAISFPSLSVGVTFVIFPLSRYRF